MFLSNIIVSMFMEGEYVMIPDYSKLWKLLIDKKVKKTELKLACKIAPGTYAKLNKGGFVSLEILARICGYLQCDIGDIMSFEVNAEENGGTK